MSKWKCEICGNEFENYHAQGFDNKIHCPLCYFKKENQELKKRIEYTNEVLELVRCDLHNRTSERDDYYRNIEMLENQQKEFIEYMNKTIEELECDDVDDEEMKGYLIQRIDIFKEILKKYNEKVTDINVGNIGDERNEKINGLE